MPDKTAETDSIPVAAELDENRPFQIDRQAESVLLSAQRTQLQPGLIRLTISENMISQAFQRGQIMTLGEELRRKYALTSLKPRAATLTIMAINEALEAAAQVADQERSPAIAFRIRCLKWLDGSIAAVTVSKTVTMPKAA